MTEQNEEVHAVTGHAHLLACELARHRREGRVDRRERVVRLRAVYIEGQVRWKVGGAKVVGAVELDGARRGRRGAPHSGCRREAGVALRPAESWPKYTYVCT